MKMTTSLVLGIALVAAPWYAFAQGGGIAGKWTGELPAAQGRGMAQPITLELKLDGEMLTGSVIEGALAARPVTNAAVEGTTFSFRTTQNFGGQDIVVNWFGEVSGDSLALSRGVGPTVETPAGGGGGRGGGGAAGGAARGAGGVGGRGAAPAPTQGGDVLDQLGGAGRGAAPQARGAAPQAGAPPAANAGGGRGGAAGAAGAPRGAAPAGAAQAGGRGAGAAGGRGGQAGGRGGAAAAAGVTRVNGGITLSLKRG